MTFEEKVLEEISNLKDRLGRLENKPDWSTPMGPIPTWGNPTPPPQKQWVGLSDEKRMNYLSNGGWEVLQDPKYWTDGLNVRQVIDRNIAALKELNT